MNLVVRYLPKMKNIELKKILLTYHAKSIISATQFYLEIIKTILKNVSINHELVRLFNITFDEIVCFPFAVYFSLHFELARFENCRQVTFFKIRVVGTQATSRIDFRSRCGLVRCSRTIRTPYWLRLTGIRATRTYP